MKITETITPANAEKTFMGSRNVTLTLDTDTEQVAIRTPAMFTDPVVNLHELKEALDELAAYKDRG